MGSSSAIRIRHICFCEALSVGVGIADVIASAKDCGSISSSGAEVGGRTDLPLEIARPPDSLVLIESLLEFVEFRRDSRLTRRGMSILNIVHPLSVTELARREATSILPSILVTQN